MSDRHQLLGWKHDGEKCALLPRVYPISICRSRIHSFTYFDVCLQWILFFFLCLLSRYFGGIHFYLRVFVHFWVFCSVHQWFHFSWFHAAWLIIFTRDIITMANNYMDQFPADPHRDGSRTPRRQLFGFPGWAPAQQAPPPPPPPTQQTCPPAIHKASQPGHLSLLPNHHFAAPHNPVLRLLWPPHLPCLRANVRLLPGWLKPVLLIYALILFGHLLRSSMTRPKLVASNWHELFDQASFLLPTT